MIKINNLYFTYKNKPPYLLNDINLELRRGEYISIVGDNGSGKSTLVKIILGILKPSKGSINVETKRIGYVPQRFEDFNFGFPMTVFEILNCHRKVHKIKNRNVVYDALDMVGMRDYGNTLIGNLSGGQQQKVFIARALMGNPEVLIVDEPSTGVDMQSQYEIYRLIKQMTLKNGMAVLSNEHNIKAAMDNSNHIFKIEGGRGYLYKRDQYYKQFQEAGLYA